MTTRELLTAIVQHCDAILIEKGVEVPSPGPRAVVPPVAKQEVTA
jgi:hypothetical protein